MQIFSAAFSFSNFLKYLIVKKEAMKKRPFQFKWNKTTITNSQKLDESKSVSLQNLVWKNFYEDLFSRILVSLSVDAKFHEPVDITAKIMVAANCAKGCVFSRINGFAERKTGYALSRHADLNSFFKNYSDNFVTIDTPIWHWHFCKNALQSILFRELLETDSMKLSRTDDENKTSRVRYHLSIC